MARRSLLIVAILLLAFIQFQCLLIPNEKPKVDETVGPPVPTQHVPSEGKENCASTMAVYAEGLGAHTFPVDGDVWRMDVPAGVEIRFRWIASAAGGKAGLVDYALDPSNPGDDGKAPHGIGGWMGWGPWEGMETPLLFHDREEGQVHTLYLRMRDESHAPQSERVCRIEMTVARLPFDRTVLVVDDATPPRRFAGTDAEHDAFRDRVLECLELYLEPGEEIDVFNMYGDDDLRANPYPLPLETIGRYKLVVWNSYFFGHQASGLAYNEYERGILSAYVKAGGRLYLYGSKPVSGLANDDYGDYVGDGICPDLPGVEDPAWDESSFIWRFLHIRNCVRSSSSGRQQVDGWIGAEPVNPLFPDIDINTDVWDPYELNDQGEVLGGIIHFQVYKEGENPAEADVALDTIYVAKAMEFEGESPLDEQPCAVRASHIVEGPAQNLSQGRVFLQTFPFVFVREDDARDAACRAIHWLMTGRDE